MISYMTKQGLPAVSDVTKATLEEFKTADKVVLVAYFAADDKASNETFTSVANGLRDSFLFGATSDAALAKAEGVKQPGLVLYKSFDDGKDVFTEKTFDADAIREFAKVASTPLIGEVGPETYSTYMAAGLPLAYIFAETPEEREEFAKELKPLALKHKGEINFATIDAKSFGQHAGNLNLKVGTWPAFAIQRTEKNEKYPYDQEKKITVKDIGSFVDDFLAGKVDPSIKSEPIPESNDGPVATIVAHNYKEIVIDNEKDVLVEFYAPWCGHCKALAPKYEELGQLYQSAELSKLVTIAKVDATLNDVPDEIQGFPTIKLFAAGKKDAPIDYSGSRTVEDLVQFIQENGSHKAEASYVESAEGTAEKLAEQAIAATKSAADAAEDATASAKSGVASGTESVKSAADAAASSASSATGSAASAASAATGSVASAASAATGSAASAASAATGSAKSAADAAASSASSATDSAASAASEGTETVKSGASVATDSASSAVSEGTATVKSAASEASKSASSAASEASASASSIVHKEL
jgi:protein disulfide-isomerase A1